MARIHPTAVVSPSAQLGADVEIGPYTVVGSDVRIGDKTVVMAHACLDGHSTIGSECTVFPFACIGTRTQDLKFKGGSPRVEIGDRTTIREYVTVNLATSDGGLTRVGSGCLIMAYAHVAHDCVVGNEVIIANCGTLAGHVIVEDQVGIGGLCGVHQFVRLGRLCYIGGCSKITQDIPPFMMADGNPLEIRGINAVGLERRGVSEEVRKKLKEAFRILYRSNLTLRDAMAKIRAELGEEDGEMRHLLDFLGSSERGLAR